MRQKHNIVVIFVKFLQLTHVVGHFDTNGLTARKEKIRNVNFVFVVLLCDKVSILVDQRKSRDGMVVPNVLNRSIYQSRIYIDWVVNFEGLFLLHQLEKDGNSHNGKHHEKDKSGEGFFKEF